jgi:hypothetical protein
MGAGGVWVAVGLGGVGIGGRLRLICGRLLGIARLGRGGVIARRDGRGGQRAAGGLGGRACGCGGRGGAGLGLGRGGRTGGGCRLGRGFGGGADIVGGNAAADARAADGVDVDAEIAGEAADGGGGQGLAVLGGHAGEGIAHLADDGAGVFAVGGLDLLLGVLGDGGAGGDGGGGSPRAYARGWDGALVGDEGGADLDDVAVLAVERGDGAGAGAWDFDKGLVGFHLSDDLVFLDGVAFLDLPGDEFGLFEALAEVGEDEDIGVG